MGDGEPSTVGGRRPRILRIITRLNVGGPSTHVVLADQGLRARGWETLLVHGRVDSGEAEIDTAAIPIPSRRLATMARPIRPLDDARALAGLVSIMRDYRPSIVHTHLSKAGLLGRTAAMLASSRAIRVHTFHGTVFQGYFGARSSNGLRWIERTLGSRTTAVIALSDRQRQELESERVCPPERIHVVPLGIDLARFGGGDRAAARAQLDLDPQRPLVLSIGRLVPIKRLDRLLRAFAQAVVLVPDARLVVVGDGPEREPLTALAEDLGITSHTTFAGWSRDSQIWYAAADVVALTSHREGTPLALIEAAAASRPVVATDVGGVADIVDDGVSGYVVGADDIAAIADAIVRVLADPRHADAMGRAAFERSDRWTADRLVGDLDRLYRDLLAAR